MFAHLEPSILVLDNDAMFMVQQLRSHVSSFHLNGRMLAVGTWYEGEESGMKPFKTWNENITVCSGYKQGSHRLSVTKFQDFSRTFPGPNMFFQGP